MIDGGRIEAGEIYPYLFNIGSKSIPGNYRKKLLYPAQRRFTKGLRYNLLATKPLACAVLQDTGEVSTALYVISQYLEAQYEAVMEELSQSSKLATWHWRAGVESMGEFPQCMAG